MDEDDDAGRTLSLLEVDESKRDSVGCADGMSSCDDGVSEEASEETEESEPTDESLYHGSCGYG